MSRILKALVTMVFFAFIGLVAFAYFGDLSPQSEEIRQPVELNVEG
jgi:type II secretory pathway component PulJ